MNLVGETGQAKAELGFIELMSHFSLICDQHSLTEKYMNTCVGDASYAKERSFRRPNS